MTKPAAPALLALAALASACAAPRYAAGLRQPSPSEPGVTHVEGRFAAPDGTSLFEQCWRAPGQAKAAVVIVHGLKDHSDRYGAAASALARGGYAVCAFDLRGHGDSAGDRVWVRRFDDYLDDLDAYLALVRSREPGKPVFVFGHSMGGAIVVLDAIERKPDLAGIVLSAPALKLTDDVGPFKLFSVRWLAKIAPRAAVLSLRDKDFSRDPRVVAGMRSDPLIYDGAGPARTAQELLSAIARVQKGMERLNTPFLALHGTADRVTNPEGSRELAGRAGSKDKALRLYEGYYHDLLHEPGSDRVLGDITAWLDGAPLRSGALGRP